jgi:hypothetical protein
MMKLVCAWCRRLMRGHPEAGRVSHAICPCCSAFMLADIGYPADNTLPDIEVGGEG